jgi:hypothetical protein
MVAARFAVGDRVRARTAGIVTEGTLGNIHHILLSAPQLYYVQFDGHKHPTLMHAVDLDRVEDAPNRERAVAAG